MSIDSFFCFEISPIVLVEKFSCGRVSDFVQYVMFFGMAQDTRQVPYPSSSTGRRSVMRGKKSIYTVFYLSFASL